LRHQHCGRVKSMFSFWEPGLSLDLLRSRYAGGTWATATSAFSHCTFVGVSLCNNNGRCNTKARRAFHYSRCSARQKHLIAEIRNGNKKKKQAREKSHEIPRHSPRTTILDRYLLFCRKHNYLIWSCDEKI